MATFPKDVRTMVKITQRPIPIDGKLFYTCWTNAGDDLEDETRGTGTTICLDIKSTDTIVSVDLSFLSASENIYIYEAYLAWENAGFCDEILAEVWAAPSPIFEMENGDYNADPVSKEITPAYPPNTGNCTLAGMPTFVRCSNWQMNDPLQWNGWWDLLVDEETGAQYPAFNMQQKGQYDWYTVELLIFRFVKFSVFGTNYHPVVLLSQDVELIPPNYFIRITAVNNSLTNWKFVGNIVIFREHTVV
jgi:hypothetical protein